VRVGVGVGVGVGVVRRCECVCLGFIVARFVSHNSIQSDLCVDVLSFMCNIRMRRK
jgi:hypothetical protein